eukprot:8339571-Pyramimonas_sp.AAC.1
MKAAQTSMQHLRSNQSLSRALLARSRADRAQHASDVYQPGDQVHYWRGNDKPKTEWALQWHGPADIIEGASNVRASHRSTTAKVNRGHLRHATATELVPWGQ